MAEALCGDESCEGRAVDRARNSGRFGRGIVGAGDGGGLLKKAGAEVVWEVSGDVVIWDFCGSRPYRLARRSSLAVTGELAGRGCIEWWCQMGRRRVM